MSWPRWPRSSAPRGAPSCSRAAARSRPAAVPLEVADDPCVVLMSATGLLARVAVSGPRSAPGHSAERAVVPPPGNATRAAHDVIIAAVRATTRGTIGVVTSAGRLVKLNVLELPALPPGAGAASLAGGTPVSEFAALEPGETVVGLASVDAPGRRAGAWARRRAWSSGCCRTTRRTGTSSS